MTRKNATANLSHGHEHSHDHAHGHHHEHTCVKHNEALVPRWQAKLITIGQLGAAALQTVGLLKGALNPAAAIDLVHNVTDAASWSGHAAMMGGKVSAGRKEKLRQFTYGMISLGGVASVAEGTRNLLVTQQEYAHNSANLTASTVSLGMAAVTATLAYRGIKKKGYASLSDLNQNKDDKGIALHAGSDLVTAGSALMSTMPHMHYSVGSVAAITAGSVCAGYFFPKKEAVKSWRHQMRYEGRHRQERRPSRFRRAVGMGTAALTLACSSIVASSAAAEYPEQPSQEVIRSLPVEEEPARGIAIDECHIVQGGESQWSITESRLRQTMGFEPSVEHVKSATDEVSLYNIDRFPNADVITIGACLRVPATL